MVCEYRKTLRSQEMLEIDEKSFDGSHAPREFYTWRSLGYDLDMNGGELGTHLKISPAPAGFTPVGF